MISGIKSKEDIEAKIALVVEMRDKVIEQKCSTLRLAFAALARGCHVDWLGSMSRFVNESFDLTMKKAEDTIRDVSPEKINGILRRMSMDTKNKTGHRGRRSTDQGGSSGDQDRGSLRIAILSLACSHLLLPHGLCWSRTRSLLTLL